MSSYQAALAQEGAGEQEQLLVSRRLSELYARAERPADRLGALERLADLEPDASARRSVLGEAARLAEAPGDTDRALGLWQRRITGDPDDLPALDARIGLLEGSGRWTDLVTALDLRAQKKVSAVQKRSDLIRIATVQRDHLEDDDAAITAWQRVSTESGEDAETVNALADLYAATGRWAEMADLLERAAGQDTRRTTARLVRLGDALHQHLGQPERAFTAYKNALAIDPKDAGRRAGLLALTEIEATRGRAADALAASCLANEDWGGFLADPAVAAGRGHHRRRSPGAATARPRRSSAASSATTPAPSTTWPPRSRSIPRTPSSSATCSSLAARTNGNAKAAAAFGAAIARVDDSARGRPHVAGPRRSPRRGPGRRRRVRRLPRGPGQRARLPQRGPRRRHARSRPGTLGRDRGRGPGLDEGARALRRGPARRPRADRGRARRQIDSLTAAVEQALAAAGLSPTIASQLQLQLAGWHRDQRNDDDAAIAALRRSLELGGDRASTLGELAVLERAKPPSPQLLETLRRLADADARDLDVLVEAAEVAGRLADRERAIEILGQVLGRATAAWRGATQVQSTRPADAVARWSVDSLVELHRAASRPGAAVDLLVEAARLPFDTAQKRELRLRAAQIAGDELGDRPAAIDMYRAALAISPGDLDIIERLGVLLDAEHRTAELLGLRQIQLGLETDAQRRLDLRLDIARLVGVVEQEGGRLEALEANLADHPGHEASIDAVAAFLAGKGQHKALADLLEQQAATVEAAGDAARAAQLWARFAGVCERDTEQIERAIAGHRKVVALAPTAESFRALARLQVGRGQPAQAVPWFESLLGTMTGAERAPIVLQLARAHLGAGQPDRAIAAIEANLDDEQPAVDLRTLLADLYRDAEAWEPLARHLTRSLGLLGDEALGGAFAREAAAIYTEKLDAPAKAIPALEKALSLDPKDKGLRARLATGLRTAGRLDEARTILDDLVAGYGRRRSPERAAAHVELARVYQAEGKLDDAMAAMEQAGKMDVKNAAIQKELAEMARAAGQGDKAERTYRALLLVVRRQPPGDDEAAVGQSEVLFELSKLAAERGEADQAKELLESAIDAATQSDVEVRRLRRSLLAHGEPETVRRVLEMRLEASDDAPSQARLLANLAAVLEKHLERSDDALDALIRAMGLAPARLDLNDQARALARRLDQTRKYVEAVESVVGRMRRKDNPPVVAGLLMKAGEALEQDAGDLAGAAGLYRRVEMLGERLAEAYYAQARVAGALGDTDEQARALDQMLQLADADTGVEDGAEPSPAQLDALYRLAEIFIQTPTRRKQGVELIERAFAAEPRWAQAGRVLKVASSADAEDPRVMALYERVARNGGDGELLLDFLDKRARLAGATPAQIREAIDMATELGLGDRATGLLEHAVAAARETVLGVSSSAWAALALAERRLAGGDPAAARDLVYEIAPDADPRDVDALAMKVATTAAATAETRTLGAEMYEFLRERNPADRAVWEPLVSLYREMGDGDRLASVISSTLPNLTDPAERNALRLQHARYLIEGLSRHHDGIEVLKDALLDDPDNLAAAALLEDTLRALGDDEGLAEFLWGRFEDAQQRGSRDATVDVALRLGALLDAAGSPDAARVYNQALVVAPDDRDVLRQVVAHLPEDAEPREAALLQERLLAVETPDRAPQLAAQLAASWEAAGDYAGVQRTLELAHRAAPEDAAIHDRLEAWYRESQQWAALAQLMTGDAERATDDEVAVTRLREAAAVYSGYLGQPLAAAEVLRAACARRPSAAELVAELAAALAQGGDLGAAQTAIGEALTGDIKGDARVDLLLTRASIGQQLGDEAASVTDLEEAFELDPAKSAQALADALDRRRGRAEANGDREVERAATLRLARLLTQYGDSDRARNLLVGWIEREPRDAEPLILLRDMDAAIQYWDGVIAACTRLAYITEADDQIDAALRVADASAQAGRPADAVPVLEVVHQQQPGAQDIRAKLREFYELAGAHRELAGVLVADADHTDADDQKYDHYKRAAELLLYNVGDAAAAADPAQKALALRPKDHAAAMLFVDVQLGSGQVESAAQGLEAAISSHKKRSPQLAVLQQRMARVAAMMGDKDGQLGWLKKAFDVDRKNGEVAAELAQLATEVGDYDLALKPLRAITLMENPAPVTRPMALLWEAKIEHARGNRAKAELWAKKALREDPAFSEAQQFLDEIGA